MFNVFCLHTVLLLFAGMKNYILISNRLRNVAIKDGLGRRNCEWGSLNYFYG
jgi:hypothetical protein